LALSFLGKVRFSKICVLFVCGFDSQNLFFVASVLVYCLVWVLVKSKVTGKIYSSFRWFWFLSSVLVSKQVAQQSVHPTLGILARFQAFFYASAFFQSDGIPPPAPARVTQTVGLLRQIQ